MTASRFRCATLIFPVVRNAANGGGIILEIKGCSSRHAGTAVIDRQLTGCQQRRAGDVFPCIATFIVLLRELGIVNLLKSVAIMVATSLIVGGLLNLTL